MRNSPHREIMREAAACGRMKPREHRTPGQIAYEQDVLAHPTYAGGELRKNWHQLGEVEQWSWERNPTPRS